MDFSGYFEKAPVYILCIYRAQRFKTFSTGGKIMECDCIVRYIWYVIKSTTTGFLC